MNAIRGSTQLVRWSALAVAAAAIGLLSDGARAQACPGQGSCFTVHPGPGCADPACCDLVCAFLPFCCDTAWDQPCTQAAALQCGPSCGSPFAGPCTTPHAAPFCNDFDCCQAVCAVDPLCCIEAWDTGCVVLAMQSCSLQSCCLSNGTCLDISGFACDEADGLRQGLGTTCSDDMCPSGACCFGNGTCQNLIVEACAELGGSWSGGGISCASVSCPFAVCPGQGDCLTPFGNGTPACDNEACCNAVCALDPFCCQVIWDGGCAISASNICGDQQACPAPGDCGLPHSSAGCQQNLCCLSVCLQEPFCCQERWDETCVAAAAELCELPPAACCLPDGSCQNLTAPDCSIFGGSPQGGGTNCGQTVCAHPGCPGSGSCFDPAGNGSAGCENELCCNTVCAGDHFCCLTLWDSTCASMALDLCGNANCPGTGDCAIANGTPGCEDALCCESVCLEDPFCCQSGWDQSCVDEARERCGVTPPATQACCLPDGSCVNLPIELCLAADGQPEGEESACSGASCPNPGCPGLGNCFDPAGNGTPGCVDVNCCAAVCTQDPSCCLVTWDGACAALAKGLCGNPACPGTGTCGLPNGTPGCQDQLCCDKICLLDPFCCSVEWDGACASEAIDRCDVTPVSAEACCFQDGTCENFAPEDCQGLGGSPQGPTSACDDLVCKTLSCPGSGSCFEPHEGGGCADPACCQLVCGTNPLCCDLAWDEACIEQAAALCEATCGSPAAGKCGIAHATANCRDEACCQTVCAVDATCCEDAWDQLCAEQAISLCSLCLADVTEDGSVGIMDMLAVILDWGTIGSANGGDVTGDGWVDVLDLVQVVMAWGACAG